MGPEPSLLVFGLCVSIYRVRARQINANHPPSKPEQAVGFLSRALSYSPTRTANEESLALQPSASRFYTYYHGLAQDRDLIRFTPRYQGSVRSPTNNKYQNIDIINKNLNFCEY